MVLSPVALLQEQFRELGVVDLLQQGVDVAGGAQVPQPDVVLGLEIDVVLLLVRLLQLYLQYLLYDDLTVVLVVLADDLQDLVAYFADGAGPHVLVVGL